jgi:hypothetical protein
MRLGAKLGLLDLENFWIMFDYGKQVIGWTTMACHVYDMKYYKVMTIVVCNMQFEDIKTQQIMWTKFNHTMLKHKYAEPSFKRFMADIMQANWNVDKIVCNSGDSIMKMVDKKHTCLFHWIQSFNRHTKQLFKPKLHD